MPYYEVAFLGSARHFKETQSIPTKTIMGHIHSSPTTSIKKRNTNAREGASEQREDS